MLFFMNSLIVSLQPYTSKIQQAEIGSLFPYTIFHTPKLMPRTVAHWLLILHSQLLGAFNGLIIQSNGPFNPQQ